MSIVIIVIAKLPRSACSKLELKQGVNGSILIIVMFRSKVRKTCMRVKKVSILFVTMKKGLSNYINTFIKNYTKDDYSFVFISSANYEAVL